jgi:hypothetical protein
MKQFPKILFGDTEDFDELAVSDEDSYAVKVAKFVAMDTEAFDDIFSTIGELMDALEEADYHRTGEGVTVH